MFAPRATEPPEGVVTRTNGLARSRSTLQVQKAPLVEPGAQVRRGASWDFSEIPLFPRERSAGAPPSPAPVVHQAANVPERTLVVGRSNDPLEHEANCVAEQVQAKPVRPNGGMPLQIQRAPGQVSEPRPAAPPTVEQVLANPGAPLEPTLRLKMEQRFGHDFSRVRVHSDYESGQSARLIDARAYTSGHHIVFAGGRFSPDTRAGECLLAHELTHVVQQTREARDLQIGLIQRDDDQHKADDATQEEKEALLNFKDDWANNFSHYDRLAARGGSRVDDHRFAQAVRGCSADDSGRK